ncbi:glycosyl transferase [Spongiactinospora gelatinilytica]|uniref:Glycosyl transferase n=1 Tax=Spongiactinospora gelatinilytica TaxID=2666298 RepID=A0A2W2F0H8_9ACTN|nr:glycosyltransferase family 9 protein [Spongiactinospora gelatinilytica]PZG28911.1 glycosyl transferase [Spongiactinospora gelatinilytica]
MSTTIDGVRRIAVLRANALGDFVMALPALAAVKAAYPGARLTLLGHEWHAGLLRGRPGPIDEVVALPPISGVGTTDPGHPVPPGLLERLARRGFDLALQLHGGGLYSNPFIRGIGARVTAGLRSPDAVPLDRWVRYAHHQHETLRLLEVAALVGGSTAAVEPALAVTGRDRAELAAVLGDPPPGLVAVHPGANDPRRRWPPERFAALADRLGRPVVVTGTGRERELADRVATAMRAPATVTAGRLGLGALAALYRRCDLLIANDTGPRHLAAAVGTPTVGIYWCGNIVNAGPLTRTSHRVLISWLTRCPVCGADGMDPEAGLCPHETSWVAGVPVEAVAEQAADLLDRQDAGR